MPASSGIPPSTKPATPSGRPVRPWVLFSCAVSIDGFLDDASPDRLILSSPADLDRVDRVRAGATPPGGRGHRPCRRRPPARAGSGAARRAGSPGLAALTAARRALDASAARPRGKRADREGGADARVLRER